MTDDHLLCWIYRSSRKQELYLYMAEKDAFDDLPEALMKQLGKPTLVMELELHPGRRLARAETRQVIADLRARGFYLQLPPELKPDLYEGD